MKKLISQPINIVIIITVLLVTIVILSGTVLVFLFLNKGEKQIISQSVQTPRSSVVSPVVITRTSVNGIPTIPQNELTTMPIKDITPTSLNVITPPPVADITPTSLEKSLPTGTIGFGIGVMGDSNSDEYRGDDNRGGPYAATTFNWVEMLVLNRQLNFGEWGYWGEPRRTGYSYNWARSDATAQGLLDSGQHTGLAKQVANGEVSYVVIFIGGNDFNLENGTYQDIYDGSLSDARLKNKLDLVVKDITLAVDTILNSGNVHVIVVNIGDKGLAPDSIRRFPDATGRQRVSTALQEVNGQIASMVTERGVVLIDMNAFGQNTLSHIDKNGFLEFGGESFSILIRGYEPHHLQLGDAYGHLGTVLSGILANAILIEPLNKNYGLGITPLTDQEILHSAGIR